MSGKYKFDEGKYKNTFENMFGKGSYNRGLSSARETGRLKAQAEFEKDEYKRRISEAKRIQKEAEKAEKAEQKRRQEEAKLAARNEGSKRAPDLNGKDKKYWNRYNDAFSYGNQIRMEEDRRKRTARASDLSDEIKKEKKARNKKKNKKDEGVLDFLTGLGKDKNKDGRADGFNFLDKTVGRASKSAQELVFGKEFVKNQAKSYSKSDNKQTKTMQKAINKKAETKLEKGADLAGTIFGIGSYAIPGTGAANLTSKAFRLGKATTPGAKLAEKLAIKGTDSAGKKLAKRATKLTAEGTGAGFLIGTGDAAVKETMSPSDRDLKEHLKMIGLETAGGAVLDPLLTIGGSAALKKGKQVGNDLLERLNILKNPSKQQKDFKNVLALPPSKPLELPEPLANPRFKFNDPEMREPKGILGLPSPKTQKVIPAKRASDEYAIKLSRLFEEANKSNMPPGREREFVEDLWSRMAEPNDPNLDKLIELATPSLKQMNMNPAELVSKARGEFNNPYGFDKYSRFKSDEVIPEAVNEGTPLAFKRERYNPVINENVSYVGQNDNAVSERILGSLNVSPKRDSVKVSSSPTEQFDNLIKQVSNKSRTGGVPVQERGKNKLNDLFEALRPPRKEVASAVAEDVPETLAENISPMKSKGKESNKKLLEGLDASKFKDISGFQAYTTDVFRNIRDVTRENYPVIKERLLDPFDASKSASVDMEHSWLNRLKSDVVDKLGITKGSKLSRLVQDYGEKKITLEELKKNAPNHWPKVIEGDKWFRKAYDELIDTVNATRSKIYPNNPEKLIPKRSDYYRHFQEFSGLTGLKNLFDSPAGIDPSLIGKSEFTKPKSKFLSFAQKRGNGAYKSDAIGGFLDYIQGASYATHIDPHIDKFKQLGNELREATADTKHLDNTIEFIEDFARDLAGKTNPADRFLQKIVPGGRTTFRALHRLNNRVKANVVLGNVGSALAQLANVPNGVAFAKQHSVKGAGRTLKSIITEDAAVKQSGFLKERYGKEIYRKFDTRWIDQPKNFAGWMIETADRVGTTFIWNSAYQKGLSESVKNPIKYADDMTRNLVAGRGIGEVPLLQKSKVFQLVAPFQLEVANLWRVQKDFITSKDFGAIATLYAGSYLLNRGMEEVRGSSVTFDPIAALEEAITEEDLTALERGGRVAGEVLSNLPFGQTLANYYPEYGKGNLPTREELFGDRDPNRFGSGLLLQKGIQDPLFKLLPPFGGNQIQKTYKGWNAVNEEAVFNKDGDKLNYPVEDDLGNRIKAALFGVGSLPESKEYYDKDRRPLSVKQTAEYQTAKSEGYGQEFYEDLMQSRRVKSLNNQVKDVQEDETLSESERRKKMDRLLKMLDSVKAQ